MTIRDVAKRAGVSTATVSAVINDNKFVSSELQQRVHQAIRELDYRPNLIARSLKLQETRTIGLVYTNVTSPIWPVLVRATQAIAQDVGLDVLLVVTDEDVEMEKTSLHSLISKRVDGIIITPALSDFEHVRKAAQNVALVVLERTVEGLECVVTNNEEISYQAVTHLVDDGHQRVGLVTIPLLGSNIIDRVRGYERALKERGIYDPSLIRIADFVGQNSSLLALDILADDGLDAVFTTSQSTALGVVHAATRLGRKIPADLALFGYDDVPWMKVITSPLSTVRQPIEEMGAKAMTLLLERLEGRAATDTVHTVDSKLLIRHSCGC